MQMSSFDKSTELKTLSWPDCKKTKFAVHAGTYYVSLPGGAVNSTLS